MERQPSETTGQAEREGYGGPFLIGLGFFALLAGGRFLLSLIMGTHH